MVEEKRWGHREALTNGCLPMNAVQPVTLGVARGGDLQQHRAPAFQHDIRPCTGPRGSQRKLD